MKTKSKIQPIKSKSILTKLEPGDGLNLGADGRCMVLEIKPGLITRVVCGALDSPVLVVLESRYVPAKWVERRLGPEAAELWREKFGKVDETGQLNNKVRIGGAKEKRNASATATTPGAPKAKRSGGYMGYAATCLIRTFIKAGWTKEEVRQFLAKEHIIVSDVTIGVQTSAAKRGVGELADFTPEFIASIRPAKGQMDLPLQAVRKPKK